MLALVLCHDITALHGPPRVPMGAQCQVEERCRGIWTDDLVGAVEESQLDTIGTAILGHSKQTEQTKGGFADLLFMPQGPHVFSGRPDRSDFHSEIRLEGGESTRQIHARACQHTVYTINVRTFKECCRGTCSVGFLTHGIQQECDFFLYLHTSFLQISSFHFRLFHLCWFIQGLSNFLKQSESLKQFLSKGSRKGRARTVAIHVF